MGDNSDIPNEICDGITNNPARLFTIIRQAILDLDRQATDANSTHTFSAFSDGGDMKISMNETSNGNPLLGSILMESSEQQLLTSSKASEEGDDSDLASEVASSASPTGKASGKSSGSKPGGGSSGKGQFKKVQAKLL
jgi:hypothetical protein